MERGAELQLDRDFARLAEGDRSALDPVFRALWPPIHQYCQKHLGQGPDADDVAQRAIERLFSQAAAYDPSRSALAWALTIALWECRSARRQTERRKWASLDVERESPDPSPEQSVEREELRAGLQVAIGKLSPTDQAVLERVLSAEAGEDIASGSTFRKRKERAVTRLREVWRRLYGI